MTTRLGISITRDACAGIVLRGRRVRWSGRVARESNAPLGPVLNELLKHAPIRRRADVRVGVSIGASSSQVKKLHGLPSTMRADAVTRLVRDNAASFFLRPPSRLVVTGIEHAADGSAWCSALEGALVDEVVESLRAAGFKSLLLLCQPLADAYARTPGVHLVYDGDVVVEVSTTERRTFDAVARRVRDDVDATRVSKAELPPTLHGLGEEAWHYVSALGAAVCPAKRALAWRPPSDSRTRRRWQRAGVAAASALFLVSAGAALVAPGARAWSDATEATRLAGLRNASAVEAARLERSLSVVTASLDRVDRFVSKRADAAVLLSELATTLPDSTALVSIRIDTSEANLSVLTTRAADVLSQLSGASGVVAPRMVGSVMRDAAGKSALERATIRFRRRRP